MKTQPQKETCLRCKKDFIDENYNPDLPFARRHYCNKCVDELTKEFGK